MAEESSVHGEEVNSHAASSSSHLDVDINPNQRLSSVLLNEFNYLPWERAVSLALGGRSKLGYVNGVIPAPDVSSSDYNDWLCKDQLVMSWLLNSMDQKVAEIFSYAESSYVIWKNLKEMYGNQNNTARVFQLKKDIASLQQEGNSFVHHLGKLTTMWNELNVYRPHTIDAAVLIKRAEEDKIFQLLASLSSKYEDLRSHVLMNPELPSFSSVCATIQREETRRKIMTVELKSNIPESRVYFSNHKASEERRYKGKKPTVKCSYCDNGGHTRDHCWILHPELRPKHSRDNNKSFIRGAHNSSPKANHTMTSHSEEAQMFTSNPAMLINEFAVFLHKKQGGGENEGSTSHVDNKPAALLGQFAGFLAGKEGVTQQDIPACSNSQGFSSHLKPNSGTTTLAPTPCTSF
ncbi:uncharacterized protein [Pyrus communis]|uniref:uncharacterized protein n=1 Tax=Pyrus communis TaxID=23211 RepID=UPI0035C07719